MSTHNICVHLEIRKISSRYALLSEDMKHTHFIWKLIIPRAPQRSQGLGLLGLNSSLMIVK